MPKASIIGDEENEPTESFEDLRDSEYEETLDEYGDGNEEPAWKDTDESDGDEDEDTDSDSDDDE